MADRPPKLKGGVFHNLLYPDSGARSNQTACTPTVTPRLRSRRALMKSQAKKAAQKAERRRENYKRKRECQRDLARQEVDRADQLALQEEKQYWISSVETSDQSKAAVKIQYWWRRSSVVLRWRAGRTLRRIGDTLRLWKTTMAEKILAARAGRPIPPPFRAHWLLLQKKELDAAVQARFEELMIPRRAKQREKMRAAGESARMAQAEGEGRAIAAVTEAKETAKAATQPETARRLRVRAQSDETARVFAAAQMVAADEESRMFETAANIKDSAEKAEIAHRAEVDKTERAADVTNVARAAMDENARIMEGDARLVEGEACGAKAVLCIEAQWVSAMLERDASDAEKVQMAREERESRAANQANTARGQAGQPSATKVENTLEATAIYAKAKAEATEAALSIHFDHESAAENGDSRTKDTAFGDATLINVACDAVAERVSTLAMATKKVDEISASELPQVSSVGDSNVSECINNEQVELQAKATEQPSETAEDVAEGVGARQAQAPQPSPMRCRSRSPKRQNRLSLDGNLKQAMGRRACRKRRQQRNRQGSVEQAQDLNRSETKPAGESELERLRTAEHRVVEVSAAIQMQAAWRTYREQVRRKEIQRELMGNVTEFLGKRKEEHEEAAAVEAKEAKLARIRPRLRLPLSRKHVEKGPDEWQIFPLQDQQGQNIMYKYHEWGGNLPALMNTLCGFPLALGRAPVFGCGVTRAAEEFSVTCGFSAAFGPLMLDKAVRTNGFNSRYGLGYDHMPMEYIMRMFGEYWTKEVVEFDTDERFFRLVRKGSNSASITRADLHPFVLAMAQRHPDLTTLSAEETSVYVDTVLATIFYDCSRCGTLTLADVRRSGLALSITYFGGWELSKEASGYTFNGPPPQLPLALRQRVQRVWSLVRHDKIRRDFLSLCGEGWTVSSHALTGYGQDGDRPVGAVRARRVLDAGVRPFPPGHSPGSLASAGGGYGQGLDYDSFVSFYLCEEALKTGKCTERDVSYCFSVVDERAEGKLGVSDFVPFFGDTHITTARADGRIETATVWSVQRKEERFASSQHIETIPDLEHVVRQYVDRFGIEEGRHCVTLTDMTKSSNVEPAGSFFEEIFSGVDMETARYIEVSGVEVPLASSTPPASTLLRDDIYPKAALEFERELADICRDLT